MIPMKKIEVLKNLEIGKRVAEDESDDLEKYFFETDQWHQMVEGNIDVVYGPKGSGKSALYTLLNKKDGELFDSGILLASAENVRGATVFRSIVADPPPSELSFIYLWKLYILTIVARALREYEINNASAKSLVAALESAGLLPLGDSLAVLFRAVRNYFKGWLNRDPKAVEYALAIDPMTGAPTFTRKTEFPMVSEEQNLNDIPVEELFEVANMALQESELLVWVLFDRLDVAFVDSPELERNALRALFRTYIDMKAYDAFAIKIFVRDDIWNRITEGGFTEASHITKSVHIRWTEENLLNLVALRLLNNDALVEFAGVNMEATIADYDAKRNLFYSLVPDQIDTGKNPDTFGWILSRTADASGSPVPREVIHMLEIAKDVQVQRLERGEPEPEGTQLFERASFKEALPTVSKVRYEQTLLAEYPEMQPFLEKLDGEKSEQTVESLRRLWGVEEEEVKATARRLVEVGFFEQRGTKDEPTFRVPFLYRSALNLVQGKVAA